MRALIIDTDSTVGDRFSLRLTASRQGNWIYYDRGENQGENQGSSRQLIVILVVNFIKPKYS